MDIDTKFFEKILVRNAIMDSAYLASIADHVKPEFFEDQRIARYFEIVKDFYDKRNVLPTFTEIKTYIKSESDRTNFKALILSFKDVDVGSQDELYENTEYFLKERSVYTTMLDVAAELQEGEVDTSIILDRFETSCNINLVTDRGFEIFSDVKKLVKHELEPEAVFSSGWPWVDENIGGGIARDGKCLIVFAGQPNIGKSIFLGNIAANIAEQGKKVLLITLEMSELLYAKRIYSKVTKVPINEFKYHTDTVEERVAAAKTKNPEGKIYIKEFPPSTITPKQLTAFVKKFTDAGDHIDAIVVDYLNLLHSPIGSNSYERVKYISEQLRAMSYVFKCPVISATQLNRSVFNSENPGMEGISESVGLAATADIILSIFQNEEDQELSVVRLGMMKNRMGPRGMIKIMHMAWDTLTAVEEDGEEDPLVSIPNAIEESVLAMFAE